MNYELTVIYDTSLTEDERDAIIKKLKIKVEGTTSWGKRMFAYPILKQKEGYYIQYQITSNQKEIETIKKALTLEKKVMRYLLIRV